MYGDHTNNNYEFDYFQIISYPLWIVPLFKI